MSSNEKKTGLSRIRFRTIIQILFFVFVVGVTLNKFLEESGSSIPFFPTVSLHGICPFGGIETLYSLITGGVFIQKIHSSALIIFVIFTIIALLFGPVFCGYFCPLGSIQEWIGKIGKKLFPKRYNQFIPIKIDKYLGVLRYVLLFIVLFLTYRSLKLIFLEIDPFYALFNFYTGEVALTALIVLTLTLLLALFVERPWCKYACPYGALMGLTNLIRLFPIKRKADSCTQCKLCNKSCPMNIDITSKERVRDVRCISCFQCTSENACPVEDTLIISKPRIRYKGVVVTTIFLLFSGVYVSQAIGVWYTESEKVPVINDQGEYDPGDIRGSYTFGDIENIFTITSTELAQAFSLEAKVPEEINVKDLEDIFEDLPVEIGTSSVRYFVSLYTGIESKLAEPVPLPRSALPLLEEKEWMTEELYNVLKASAVDLDLKDYDAYINGDETTTQTNLSEESHDESSIAVKGKTMVQEVLDAGLSKETIEEILGVEIESNTQVIRDICTNNGISFSEVKDALNEKISELNK